MRVVTWILRIVSIATFSGMAYLVYILLDSNDIWHWKPSSQAATAKASPKRDLETLKDEDDENSESWLVTPAVALGGSDELVVSIDIDKGSFLAGDDAFYFDKPD